MRSTDVNCLSCGSTDTMRERLRGVDDYEEKARADTAPAHRERWFCRRCDHSFIPTPAPSADRTTSTAPAACLALHISGTT
jgi:hypothetical protein